MTVTVNPDIYIMFDGPPGPESGRFVEIENALGASIEVGEWVKRGDFWALHLTPESAFGIAGAPA